MAATVTIKAIVNNGNKWEIVGSVALDSSYPTGGYPIPARKVGLCYLEYFGADDGYGGYLFDYDYVNNKLRVSYPQGGSSGGTNDGSGTVTSGGTGVTSTAATGPVNSAPSRECQNTKDLSALTLLRFKATGS